MTNRTVISKSRTAISLALIAAVLLGSDGRAGATGASAIATLFHYSLHPELPLSAFARGELGIIRPSWARSYLVVAYRYLTGRPLDANEQREALATWDARLDNVIERPRSGDEQGDKAWRAARAAAGAPALPVEPDHYQRSTAGLYAFENCPDEVFTNAAKRLREQLAAKLAGDEIRGWVSAQDQVFASCPAPAPAPPPLPAGASAHARAERNYQIAASHFYGARYPDAQAAFEAIGHDSSSPWAPWGEYLAARALLRGGNLDEAAKRLDAIAAGKDAAMAARAGRLVGFIRYRLEPDAVLARTAKALATHATHFGADLNDYTWLLSCVAKEDADLQPCPGAPSVPDDPLSTWIHAMKGAEDGSSTSSANDRAASYATALEGWRKQRSAPWLIAALVWALPGDEGLDAVTRAAARVKRGEPGWLTVTFHRARLLGQKSPQAARPIIDEALATLVDQPASAAGNVFHALRLRGARSLDDLVTDAPRAVLGVGDEFLELPEHYAGPLADSPKAEPPLMRLDVDGAWVFTHGVPLERLAALASDARLGSSLAESVARTAFLRAVVLGDWPLAVRLAPAAARTPVRNAAAWTSALGAIERGEGDEATRAFGVALALLPHPDLDPWFAPGLDSDGGNWCGRSDERPPGTDVSRNSDDPLLPALGVPPIGSADERRRAADEFAKLAKLGAGANVLARLVLSYAESHRDDPRVPDALVQVNEATRRGCRDDSTSTWSKRAYNFLHRTYPKSPATKRVKYWY